MPLCPEHQIPCETATIGKMHITANIHVHVNLPAIRVQRIICVQLQGSQNNYIETGFMYAFTANLLGHVKSEGQQWLGSWWSWCSLWCRPLLNLWYRTGQAGSPHLRCLVGGVAVVGAGSLPRQPRSRTAPRIVRRRRPLLAERGFHRRWRYR